MARRDSPWRHVRLGDLTPTVEHRGDGTVILRAKQALADYPGVLTDRLVQWASVAPDRTLLAWRVNGSFERLSYGEALDKVRCLGQAILDRQLSADRPLAILSGNSVEHLLLALAAQHVGVPFAPISPAYSLVSTDFSALKHVFTLLSPGLVFAADPARFAPALSAALSPDAKDVEVAHGLSSAGGRSRWPMRSFEELLSTVPTTEVDRRHAAIATDDIAKILFTSGSTGTPKGVINTHRMLCSNQQAILQTLPCLGDEPPVLVDWLPWHHTFGGNHNIGIVVYNGGSLYLDEGRPMAGGFDESVRNLRDVAPTIYLNVPKGYEELVRAFRRDRALASKFFARVQVLFYAAAGLSQHVADELQQIAVEACGERLVLVTGLGATETAPMAVCRPWADELSSAVGLPVPGVVAKLAPSGDKLELRVRGPNVMPGYWRQEALTRDAFDEEGFYCMGDARASGRYPRFFERPRLRWTHQRRFQALHRDVGQRRPSTRAHPRALRPIRSRCGDRRTRPRSGRNADRARRRRLPDFVPGSPAGESSISRPRACPSGRVPARASFQFRIGRDWKCHETRTGDHPRRATVARCRGDYRQGLAQPARNPRSARLARGSALLH